MKGQKYVSSGTTMHPLSWGRNVTVRQHRVVLWEKIGPGEHACHWCACRLVWAPTKAPLPPGFKRLVVDHLDDDRQNNDPSNLVPACNACNTLRSTQNAGRRRKVRPFSTKTSVPYAEPMPPAHSFGPSRVVMRQAYVREQSGQYRWQCALSCGHSVSRRGGGDRTLCYCERCSDGEPINLSLLRSDVGALQCACGIGQPIDVGRLRRLERELAQYEGVPLSSQPTVRRPYPKKFPRPVPRERPAITWARFVGMIVRRAPGRDPLNASPRVVAAFLRERRVDGVRGLALLEEANVIGLRLREAHPERWSNGTPSEIVAELKAKESAT